MYHKDGAAERSAERLSAVITCLQHIKRNLDAEVVGSQKLLGVWARARDRRSPGLVRSWVLGGSKVGLGLLKGKCWHCRKAGLGLSEGKFEVDMVALIWSGIVSGSSS